MNGRMLPHLELGEMESEGLDLPDELLQLTVCVPTGPGAHERLLHDGELGEQLRRVAIGEVGVAGAGGGDATGDQEQDAAVRFARRPLGDLFGGVLVGRPESLPEREQRIGRRSRCRVERQAAADPVRRTLEAEQHVLARDRRRPSW